jgi:uncharacterized protein YcbX
MTRLGDQAADPVGRIGQILRYPVKSMLGESLSAIDVIEHGFPADRGLAFVDEATGKVVSAKVPARWRAMLQCSARLEGYAATITLPDGTEIDSDDESLEDLVSELVGRRVTIEDTRRHGDTVERSVPEEVIEQGLDADVDFTLLELAAASPEGSFVDYAPLHLVTSASLAAVSTEAGHEIPALRYRPNLVIDLSEGAGFVENAWVGSTVRIGSTLTLRIVLPTPRCAVPTLAHGGIAGDNEAVSALNRVNRIHVEGFGVLPSIGVYAEVVTPGRIAVGDPVVLL